MPPAGDGGSPAPIDRAILEHLRDRLATTRQFTRVEIAESGGHTHLQADLGEEYYPGDVVDAALAVRWYANDDFAVHYRERHEDGAWECRWNRHPNSHNARDHYHPPPNAATPGEDEDWPTDYRRVIETVLSAVESRIRTLWDQT